MVTNKQVQAARRNARLAQKAATRKRTIAHLSTATRRDLSRRAAAGRSRGGRPGRALEDRNREQLYDLAERWDIPGRSKMGKWELIQALPKAR